MIVTIDGPAGSGKSTTARLVAKRLGYKYIDSGATYRAVALVIVRQGVDPKDENKVTELSKGIGLDFKNDRVFLVGQHRLADGEDVTELLRDEKLGQLASLCSTYLGVRENMVNLQRRLANTGNVVCEGRDIGTVVFPDAEVKIYMDAGLDERARRRKKELAEKCRGVQLNAPTLEQIKEDLKLRDEQDRTRKHSPLRVPEGAVIIDTTNLSIEEEVDKVIEVINKLGRRARDD